MDRSIFQKRIARLRSFFSKEGLDSMWIKSSENRRYISGFKVQDILITESAGSLLIGKDFTVFLTDPRYELEAKESVSDFDIRILRNNQLKDFCKTVTELNIKRLGFEKEYLSYGTYMKIKDEFKRIGYEIELIPVSGIVEKMRQIKDSYEIKMIKKSADMILHIMEELKEYIKPGVTERDLCFKVYELAFKYGAEDLAFPPIIASGPNSALPHAVPTEKKIKEHEVVIVDIGVKVDGYCSDITRTFFVGKADSELEKIYSLVRDAQRKAIEEAKAGIKASDLDKTARKIIEDAGYGDYFSHGLGHGVGLSVHEAPSISKIDSTVLAPGMVITIEPGIYIPNKGGVRLEEMILIKEDGSEVITER